MKLVDLFQKKHSNGFTIQKPYIIAEAGVNHEGNIDIAKRLIREAKEGGADAIKFQTYKADRIASKNSLSYWDLTKESTKSQYELFKKYDSFGKDDFEELKKVCDRTGIEFLSTPFDIESATYLNEMMDVFKISSSDITNKPFIDFLCGFNKPIILSTGASTLSEIKDAKTWIDQNGNPLALLHCVLNYPTDDNHAHLGRIIGLKNVFPDIIIGYSDHTIPKQMKILEIATLLGARILEKHFTFDKKLPGNDHYHAMDKEDLKIFLNNLDVINQLIGTLEVIYDPSEEIARKNARRSLVAKHDIPLGKVISADDITWKRPGIGISPKSIDQVIGKVSLDAIKEDSILTWEMIK